MDDQEKVFRRLARDPIDMVISRLKDHMRTVAMSEALNSVGFKHPRIVDFIESQGYTVREVLEEYLKQLDF